MFIVFIVIQRGAVMSPLYHPYFCSHHISRSNLARQPIRSLPQHLPLLFLRFSFDDPPNFMCCCAGCLNTYLDQEANAKWMNGNNNKVYSMKYRYSHSSASHRLMSVSHVLYVIMMRWMGDESILFVESSNGKYNDDDFDGENNTQHTRTLTHTQTDTNSIWER